MSSDSRRGGRFKRQWRKTNKIDLKKKNPSGEKHNSIFQSLWRTKMMSVVEEKNNGKNKNNK